MWKPGEVFERFTDRARQVLVHAQEEARLLNHAFIGTEHVLLGLIDEGEGVAARALAELDISPERVRSKIEETVGHSDTPPSGSPPFTPRTKKVLELSLREALQLGHNHVGTEHLLLGLIREGEGVGAQVLARLGADSESIRQKVILLLAEPESSRRSFGERSTGVWVSASSGPSARRMAGGALAAQRSACSFCGRNLWEVRRYFSARAATICEKCVGTASSALEGAESDGEIPFPPRLFGEAPDDEAVDRVVAAFSVLFDTPPVVDTLRATIEDADELVPYLLEAAIPSSPHDRVRVDRLRFIDTDTAEIDFMIPIKEPTFREPVPHEVSLSGHVVRRDTQWLVGRDTVAKVLRFFGVKVPPRSTPG